MIWKVVFYFNMQTYFVPELKKRSEDNSSILICVSEFKEVLKPKVDFRHQPVWTNLI